jgi:hypothetical protein
MDFKEKAIQLHGDKYDYSKVIYKNGTIQIIIICKIHGEFLQTPVGHLLDNNCEKCPKCVVDIKTKEFIQKAIDKHGNKYDYSLVKYKRNSKLIIIICKEHGEFKQTPTSHLNISRSGCLLCVLNERQTEFINKAIEIHGDKYDYSKVIFNIMNSKIMIICKIHGEFEINAIDHICKNKSGCKKCTHEKMSINQRNTFPWSRFARVRCAHPPRPGGRSLRSHFVKKLTLIYLKLM